MQGIQVFLVDKIDPLAVIFDYLSSLVILQVFQEAFHLAKKGIKNLNWSHWPIGIVGISELHWFGTSAKVVCGQLENLSLIMKELTSEVTYPFDILKITIRSHQIGKRPVSFVFLKKRKLPKKLRDDSFQAHC